MSYSTIYDFLTGHVITDGVQSQAICNETINTARSIARDLGHSVIVEDRGTRECYRITPAGHKWRAKGWTQASAIGMPFTDNHITNIQKAKERAKKAKATE